MGAKISDGIGRLARGSVVDPNIAALASATTIVPTDIIHRITGNTDIVNITPPDPYFNGPLYLYNTDSSVGATTTAGNIALITTFTRYKLFAFVYDPSVGKWYPSAAS